MFCKLVTSIALLFSLVSHSAQEEECQFFSNCLPPFCRCFTTLTPVMGSNPTPRTPQFVILTFDDAITTSNFPFYAQLTDLYKNPNGCGITMTFFVNHMYNDYTCANELHRFGHEIGVRSVTAQPDIQGYWSKANYSVWESEMADMRSMLVKYGLIPFDDVQGARAPYLEMGGDEMFSALHNNSFLYDASWVTLNYTNWYSIGGSDPLGGIFPYTLDFKSPQDVQIGTGPKHLHPGFWELPLLDLQDPDNDPCNTLDTCKSNVTDCGQPECTKAVYDFLISNFNNNYDGNRVPFGISTSYSWFLEDDVTGATTHKDGFMQFLDYATGLEDVYFITFNQLLAWMNDPVDISIAPIFEPFSCPTFPLASDCVDTMDCGYKNVQGLSEVKMKICAIRCPPNYPWLGNVDGN